MLMCHVALAQMNINGKVTDNNASPIFGATISYVLENTTNKGGTVTAEDGNFSFELSTTGNYQITVSYIGMKTLSFQKYIQSNDRL